MTKIVCPAFIQISARHKDWDSTVICLQPFLGEVLQANNLHFGNKLEDGWSTRCSGGKRSFQPNLPKSFINPPPQNWAVDNVLKNYGLSVFSQNTNKTRSQKTS